MATLQRKFIGADQVSGDKIRLDNNQALRSRNAANSANIDLIKLDASNIAQLLSQTQIATTPSAATDVANKSYVDTRVANVLSEFDFKASVRVASTANVVIASELEDGDSIDGVTLATGDRVLLKNQSTASQNGIYVVVASGAASRATDFDADAEVTAMSIIPVSEGTAAADTVWMLTTNDPIVVGTTALSFAKLGPSSITAGNGISVSGTTVSVAHDGQGLTFSGSDLALELDGSTLSKSASGVKVADAGITETQLATSVAGAGLAGGAGTALSVNVDASTIEINVDTLRVKDAGITEAKLAASVAGNGLAGGAGTALSVNVDDSTIEINTDSLRVKDAGITAAKIAAAVAGAGLSGGAGSALAVNVDDSTIEINTDTLRLKDAGVTSAKLAAAVAGDGLSGGAGSALSVNSSFELLTLNGTDITNQYKDMAADAILSSIQVSVSGVAQTSGVDFTVTDEGANSRITFAGDLATGGPAALVSGDVLNVTFISK